jgi:hypothetical protein
VESSPAHFSDLASPASSAAGNPFYLDVCTAPFSVVEAQSVSALNHPALTRVGAAIEDLREGQGSLPASGPLLLLTAPRAGYGKTHLLGRIAAQTEGHAVALPVIFRPDNDLTWPALASESLSALAHLPSATSGWDRLRETCAGIFASLVRRMVQEGQLPCANRQQAERVLASDPKALFAETGGARVIGDWLKKNYAQIRRILASHARVPSPSPHGAEAWVDALFACAQHGTAATVSTVTSLSCGDRMAFITWIQLVASWRPVVLMVDHLDGFYRNEQAGLRIATMVLELASLEGTSLVLSMNQDLWQATFAHHLPSALEDRLTAAPFLLRGITASEAQDLTLLRLQSAHAYEDEALEFIAFLRLERWFESRPTGSVSVRAYLRHAAQQWEVFQDYKARGEDPAQAHSEPEAAPPLPPIASVEPVTTPFSLAPVQEVTEAPSIFPQLDTEAIQRMAESLSEPTPAMVRQTFAPAPLAAHQGGTTQLPASQPDSEPPAPEPFLLDDEGPIVSLAQPGQPQAPGAMEKLRDMMERLRQQPAPATSAPELAVPVVSSVAARLANVMEPGPSAQSRFEELRLEAAAEVAPSVPLDYGRIAEVIRLAGRRFPLVRYDDFFLPNLTNRTVPRWSIPGMEVLFGLSPLTDTAYWHTLAEVACLRISHLQQESAQHNGAVRLKVIVPKSEQDTLAWTALQSNQSLPYVFRAQVEPMHLDPRSLASLYATQRLIQEAESGVLQVSPPHLMSIVTRELDFLWKRVTRSPVANG